MAVTSTNRFPWRKGAALMALALSATTAFAQSGEEDPAAIEEASAPAPTVRVVGFVDHSAEDNCDQVARQYGRCVEEVDFMDTSVAWSDAKASAVDGAIWRNTGRLYAQLWEDLAVRWHDKEDVEAQVLGDSGVSMLNSSASQWQATNRQGDRVYALPDPSLWFNQSRWEQMRRRDDPSDSFFRQIRVHHPSGTFDAPPTILLRGRFATRLAYDGRRHNYDLMDGDSDSSGPFFEQMYPYKKGIELAGGALAPLSHFIVPEQLKGADTKPGDVEMLRRDVYRAVTLVPDAGYDDAKALATDEFHDFYHLVGTQIVRFALEEYTPTHLRVLTSLIAMRSPPSRVEGTLSARDVVAASEGQTDDSDLIEAMANVGAYATNTGFELNYAQLPEALVEDYVQRFPEWHDPSPEFLNELNEELYYVLQDYLRRGAPGVSALDDASLKAWVEKWALPGRAPDVNRHLKRVALSLLVSRMDDSVRDELETRLLLDHVDMAVSSHFDPTLGFRATPQEMEDLAGDQWRGTLGLHGFSPVPIPDGPGAVDPVAICTTKDRREALKEKVFGAVDLDLLVVADDGLGRAEKVLWQARDKVPFLMMDNPKVSKPQVTRLVGLPAGRAIYRLRWKVWSGWHFFWSTEKIAEGDDTLRLVLRTGAVCDDTVLAAPDLVPTLARAALLEGDFIPATPTYKAGTRKERRAIAEEERIRRERPADLGSSAEEDVDKAADDASAAAQVKKEAGQAQDLVSDDVTTTDDEVLIRGARVADLFVGREAETISKVGDAAAPVSYIRDLMRAPLNAIAAAQKLLLVVVFDSAEQERRPSVWQWRPRSPYASRKTRAGTGPFIRTASWAHAMFGPADEPVQTLLSPAYRPTESANSGSVTPRWKRRRNSDFAFVSGLASMPYRQVNFTCPSDATDLSDANDFSTAPRCQAGDTGETRTDGLGLDVASLVTWWLLDQPRMAVEFGPELRIDVVPSGYPRFDDGTEDAPRYAWTFSPRFGFLGGLRAAPDAHPLWVRGGKRTPWGAEGPDGSSRLGRSQYGLRAGFLMGPGYNGLDGIVLSELWWGRSIRKRLSPQATLTPYHPRFVFGPFVRGQYGFTFVPDSEVRYSELKSRYELFFGLRGQLRLNAGQPAIPSGS